NNVRLNMTNRISSFVCTLVATCFFACGVVAQDGSSKPNIILIVSDDQGYGDASCSWETDLRTPVMDRIARQGVRLNRFRVNPLCAPTRASVMTGLYSLHAGMWRGPGALEAGPVPVDGWPLDA